MACKRGICWLLPLIVIFSQLAHQGNTEKVDSFGRKFMFAFPTPYKPSSVSGTFRPMFHVIMSTPSSDSISGTLNCPGVVHRQTFTTSFNRPGNVTITATDYLGYSFTLSPRTITVEADGDIAVHAFYAYSNFATEWLMGSTNVMPIEALGKEYYVASYAPYSTRKSVFTVSALDEELETVVEIVTKNGERYREVLAPSNTYQLESGVDLTGSLIRADKPVSVMSGSSCSKVPTHMDRCNYLIVHLTDVKSAGTQFVLSPFKDRTNGYIFRVIATEDNSRVNLSPGNITIELHASEFHEIDVIGDAIWFVTSSAPVLAFKYGKGGSTFLLEGDPIMVNVPAINHFVSTVTFPVAYLPTTSDSKYSLSITIACQLTEGLILDGRALGALNDVLIGPDSFCEVRLPIDIGIHTISHISTFATLSVVIHAIAYKIGYAYPGGYNVRGQMLKTGDMAKYVPKYLGDDGLTLLCQENHMVVFVNKSMVVEGQASDVHFTDPLCFGQTVNGSIIAVAAGYTACGTVIEETTASIYKNHLIYRGPKNPGPIMRDTVFDIPVSCTQNNRVLVSLALSPQTKTINQTLEGQEKLLNVTYSFQIFHSKKYNTAYTEEDFPVTVELGQSLYFEASASGIPGLKIMPQQCLTTESSDPFATPNYIFVDNGCASDDTVKFYKTEDASKMRFSLLTFGFVRDVDSGVNTKAYVHCWLLACNSSDSSSRCNSDCSDRGQRDTVRQTSNDLGLEHIHISQGPIIILLQDHGDTSNLLSNVASAVGGTVFGIILLILLLVVLLFKVKQRRGRFSLHRSPKRDDTLQLIDMSHTSTLDD